MNPALLQHIGTSSSLFSGKSGKALNQKWHMSRSFPVQVAMPGEHGARRRSRHYVPSATACPVALLQMARGQIVCAMGCVCACTGYENKWSWRRTARRLGL